MTEKQSNAISFEQMLKEIKATRSYVKDIYYSEHIGNWTLQYQNGDCQEFESAQELLSSIDYCSVLSM